MPSTTRRLLPSFLLPSFLLPSFLLPSLPVLLAAGCENNPPETGTPEDPSCVEDPSRFADLSLTPTAMPTVFRATWTTAAPSTGSLEAVFDDTVVTSAPEPSARTDHDVLLVGLPEQTTARVVAYDDDGAETWCSPSQEVTSGTLPGTRPTWTVDGEVPPTSPFALVPLYRPDGSSVTLLDPRGRLTWAWDQEEVVTRARLSRDEGPSSSSPPRAPPVRTPTSAGSAWTARSRTSG